MVRQNPFLNLPVPVTFFGLSSLHMQISLYAGEQQLDQRQFQRIWISTNNQIIENLQAAG
jgi:hypothetical protein